jgi:4-alpha-glucanotransferase
LHEDGSPIVVAGVPPDAFSKAGQRWGNPIYDWERMRAEGFRWWIERLRAALTTVDVVRIDHFRGFAATWEVPAEHDTAEDGQWVEVPGRALFNALKNSVGEVPIIAEDLGMLTPDVHALRDACGFPGMRVLQFAFNGDPCDTHLPHNYIQHTVVYTGTHDNDTVVGWFESRPAAERAGPDELMGNERAYSLEYLHSTGEEIHWDFICAAFASVADQAIIPLQDLLGLGASARMNVPASTAGNWAWRYSAEALTEELGRRLQRLTQLYGRLPAP